MDPQYRQKQFSTFLKTKVTRKEKVRNSFSLNITQMKAAERHSTTTVDFLKANPAFKNKVNISPTRSPVANLTTIMKNSLSNSTNIESNVVKSKVSYIPAASPNNVPSRLNQTSEERIVSHFKPEADVLELEDMNLHNINTLTSPNNSE